MNAFSAIFLFLIWGAVALLLLLVLRNNEKFFEKKLKFFLLALVLLSVFFSVYARFGLSHEFIFNSTDENILKQNFDVSENAGSIFKSHSSGPGFLALLTQLQLDGFAGFELGFLIAFLDLFFSAFTVLIAFALLREVTSNQRIAFGGVLCTMFSGFFIWPLIELKPQSAGMVLFFALALLLVKALKQKKASFVFLAALVLVPLAFMHLWSLLLSYLFLTFALFYVFLKKNPLKLRAGFAALLFLWMASLMLFLSLAGILWDLHFVVREAMGAGGLYNEIAYPGLLKLHVLESGLNFSYLVFVPALLLTGLTFLALAGLKLAHKRISRVFNAVLALAKKTKPNRIRLTLLGLILAAITIQSVLHLNEITRSYLNPTVFLVLHSTDFFLLAAGSLTLAEMTRKNDLRRLGWVFFVIAPLLCIFALTLFAGFFLKEGFANFEIRTLNYLVLFLGLFAFMFLARLPKQKRNLVLVFVLLFPLGLFTGTREPSLIPNHLTYYSFEKEFDHRRAIDWRDGLGKDTGIGLLDKEKGQGHLVSGKEFDKVFESKWTKGWRKHAGKKDADIDLF